METARLHSKIGRNAGNAGLTGVEQPEWPVKQSWMTNRCQSHQHFTRNFFIRKFCPKLFCTYILGLNFFWRKNICANALIKCWWNWPQVSISPPFNEQLFCSESFTTCCIFLLENLIVNVASLMLVKLTFAEGKTFSKNDRETKVKYGEPNQVRLCF